MSTRWSDLPPELIIAISRSLTTIADYTRFRSVCSSWRSAATPNPRHLPLQSPWLAFQQLSKPSHFTFFPLPNPNKIHSLPIPKSHRFLGSSDGTLALRSESGAVSLINPLTRFHTRLPFLKIFPMSPFFLKKIVLSPHPTPAALALALLGCSTHLALCRPAVDGSWTLIQGSSTYHDALFFNGKFHVVDGFRRVFSLDDGGAKKLTEVARVRISRAPPFIGRGEKCYMVELGEDLLLVVRNFSSVSIEGQRDAVATKGFEVFRLQMETGDHQELKSLGNCVMFLGLNTSVALGGDGCCPGFRGDCIYFLDDTLNFIGDLAQSVGDAGVFDMSDGSIEPLRDWIGDSVSVVRGRQPAVWITPSLC